jgi:hypothetical protein
MSTAVGIVGGLGETVEIDTSHPIDNARARGDDASDPWGGQRRPDDGSAPGRRGAIGAADTTTPAQATRNRMMKPP